MVRDATLDDVDDILAMIQEATSKHYKLIPDRDSIKRIIVQAISSKQHWLQVGYDKDKLTGCMLVGSNNFDFAKKMMAQISFFNFQNLAQGTALIDNMMRWVRDRKAIQMVVYTIPYYSFSPLLLENKGFKSSGSMTYWRRQWDFSQKSGKV